ncbi:hypothetical protein [Nocardiopsis nanhaiensis]
MGRTWGQVKLPKLGWVRLRWSRAPKGTIRSATVSRAVAHCVRRRSGELSEGTGTMAAPVRTTPPRSAL